MSICAALGVEFVLVSDDESRATAFRSALRPDEARLRARRGRIDRGALSGKIAVDPGQNVVAVVSGGNVAPQQAAAILAS